MRVCHLDTCPVGVATQNPELRKRFSGKPEFVVTFFEYIAEEVREHLAALGFRSIAEAVGHAEVLDTTHGGRALEGVEPRPHADPRRCRSSPTASSLLCTTTQDHGLDRALDQTLIALCEGALQRRAARAPRAADPQRQPHGRHDARLEAHPALRRRGPARRHDHASTSPVPPGQSFGAFVPRASRCGSRATRTTTSARASRADGSCCSPTSGRPFVAEENIIAGNVALYGATSGEA